MKKSNVQRVAIVFPEWRCKEFELVVFRLQGLFRAAFDMSCANGFAFNLKKKGETSYGYKPSGEPP